MNIIEARNIRKVFKDVVAVDGIDIYVKKGEILGILGPNGAGKTTAISMIATLLLPDGGDILLQERSILKEPKFMRRILGLVPQDVALYLDLSGRENLEFFGRVYGLSGKALEMRIKKVLEIVGLNGKNREIVKNYSGGMKRRLNIGVALLHDPEILIMDEPTVGIDPQSRNHILETVKGLNEEGKTVIYTSHYMEEVDYLCDRIYIMDYGKIIAEGSPDELKAMISREDVLELKATLFSQEFIEDIRKISGVKHILHDDSTLTMNVEKGKNILSDVFNVAQKYHTTLISVNVKVPTLEDVFLSLTGRGLRD
ncbi:MAG: linearmycin/streptolysin transport system ATP-binding protein [Thermoanaerobacteraceae bacterium]|jgi:ABC-2 type transport system ATP-binding protein|nr:linearmycin/streptolysin transport system ATP-binding protein [Thermoanaerobacteraceae bacterium]